MKIPPFCFFMIHSNSNSICQTRETAQTGGFCVLGKETTLTKALKTYEKAYKDYKRGMSYKDIADKYNVSLNAVRSWKTRHWNHMAKEEEEAKELECAQKAHYDAHHLNGRQAAEMIKAAAEPAEDGRGQNATQNSQNINAIKELVEVKKASAPPAYRATDAGKMINRIGQYFQRQAEKNKPCTRAGLILALDISRDTYRRYLNGEMDYLLEEYLLVNQIDMDSCDRIQLDDGTEIPVDCAGNPLITFSAILQKAVLKLEEQAEERLYSKARPGDIFTLKQYGWTDEKSPGTVNNTLVIASAEESDRALRMLYGDK